MGYAANTSNVIWGENYHVLDNIEIGELFTDNCANMHRQQWDDLQFVLAVAELGSLSSAARAMGVHHATVLRRVAAFEEYCGVKLFIRGARGYHLSPESNHVLAAIRSIDDQIGKLGRTIASQGDSLKGVLRVTTMDSLSTSLGVKYCRALNMSYPEIQIELLARNDRQNLSKMEADIAIRACSSLSPELRGEYVCEVGFRAYAAPEYIKGKESVNNAAHHEWLGLSGLVKGAGFSNWLDANIPASKICFRADSFVTLAAAAEYGGGIALLPCYLGDQSKKLVRVENIAPRFSIGLWVATHEDLSSSPKIQMAMSFFIRALNEDKALVEG